MKKIFIHVFIICIAALYAQSAFADTLVSSDIINNVVWNKEGSPYVLENDITIAGQAMLTVLPGTQVVLGGYSLEIDGGIAVNGTSTAPVEISNGYMNAADTNTSYSYADFSNVSMSQGGGTFSMSRSALSGGTIGISLVDASSTLDHVTVRGFTRDGIYARRGTLNITKSEIKDNGTGVHIQDKNPVLTFLQRFFPIAHANTNSFVFERNNFIGNTVHINNEAVSVVDARNNWWGNQDGPQGTVLGSVLYDPWLKTPFVEIIKNTCCSSVFFLPGLEGSRLYTAGILSTENQLWEPNRNADVSKLNLNNDGSSKDKGIYTRDVIEDIRIPGIINFPIYKTFADDMRRFVSAGVFSGWKEFPYDWRFDPDYLIASTTLVGDIQNLATQSLTGKVTIVAHSNGGLIAKRLVQELQRLGKSDVVDKIVFVAVPHFGTPQAVASLLYGEGQEIMHGIILSKSTAQSLAHNMPTAYDLLPASTSQLVRSQNSYLLQKAQTLHVAIDHISFPQNIEVHTIVGTGIPTLSDILYKGQDHRPVVTLQGDGVVIQSSAEGGVATNLHIFDAGQINLVAGDNHNHSDLLEVGSIELCIKRIITNQSCDISPVGPAPKYQLIGIHSPADISLVDSSGRITNQAVEQIPNSAYMDFGEGKYIVAPEDSSMLTVKGTGSGTFTLDIQTVGVASSTVTFSNIPVTASTTALLQIQKNKERLLRIDVDGDGIYDATITPTTTNYTGIILKILKWLLQHVKKLD